MPEDSRQPEEPVIDRRSADIGIVCTQALEVRPLLKKLDRVRKYVDGGVVFRGGFLDEVVRVAVVEAGAGFAKHREAAKTLIEEHHPAWVFSVGFSSPLTEELKSGDVCLANELCDTHGNSLPVKCSIPERKRIFVRKHVVADSHPGSAEERCSLADSSSAAAVDTTSLAVAQACNEQPTGEDSPPAARFLAIRGIVGATDDELTEKVVEYLFEPAVKQKAVGIGHLLKRVKPDPELAPWKKAAEETAVNLNRFVLSLITQVSGKLKKTRF